MTLLDVVGLTKRFEQGQHELNERLDRVIELLEALLAATAGQTQRKSGPVHVRRAARSA